MWKENGKTHMSVTNDTLQLRKLVVNADGVTYTYDIPPGKGFPVWQGLEINFGEVTASL